MMSLSAKSLRDRDLTKIAQNHQFSAGFSKKRTRNGALSLLWSTAEPGCDTAPRILRKLLSSEKCVDNLFFLLAVALLQCAADNILITQVFRGFWMSEGLTRDQVAVLEFLAATNNSPSYREIGRHLGERYTASSVQRILERLQRKGFISKTPRKPRSILVLRRVAGAPAQMAA
jgi:LexA DNA binding domain